MLDGLHNLIRTVFIATQQKIVLPRQRRPAGRADGGKRGRGRDEHVLDLGDDLAAADDLDLCTRPQPLLLQQTGIVSRDPADGRPGNVHGFDHKDRCDLATAADLPDHLPHLGQGSLALALDRDLPAIVMAGGAHGPAHVLVQHLHHHPVQRIIHLRRELLGERVHAKKQLRPAPFPARQLGIRHEMHGLVGQGFLGELVDRVRGHAADHQIARMLERVGQVFLKIALQDDHLAHALAPACSAACKST